jgi:glycosyltransferase involved in cell wall biosynthesis
VSNHSPSFSVVIPICNEEENIPLLYEQLSGVMERECQGENGSKESFEIILIDDGSKDGSWQKIKELNAKDSRVKGISFSRNFGHHVALTAGLDHARGMAVVLMDGDLQDPPDEIPRLLNEFREGYDLVYGIRQERNDPFLKKISSNLFWWILRRFSGVDIPKGQTMLRVLSRRLVDALKDMREQARFIHGMMAWTGFSSTTVTVKHNPRQKGKSKYDIARMFRLAFHAVTSFSTVPLRLAIYMGLFSSLVSFFVGLFFLYKKVFLGIPVLGFAAIIVSIFFVGGIQLLIFGIFGEYLGRTYQEVQRRPLYLVRESLL